MNTEVEIRIHYNTRKFFIRRAPIGFSRQILFHKDGVSKCLYSNDKSQTRILLNIIGYQKNAKLSRPQKLLFPKIIKQNISFRAQISHPELMSVIYDPNLLLQRRTRKVVNKAIPGLDSKSILP
jgi:hypothetical protein